MDVDDDDSGELSGVQSVHSTGSRDCLAALQCEGTARVARLRVNSSIPYSIIPNIVDSINSMITVSADYFQSETLKVMNNANVTSAVISPVECSLQRQGETSMFLSTRYEADKYFDEHPLAVKPDTVVLGQRLETRNGVTQMVYDSYEYVSVEATLRTLLMNPQYSLDAGTNVATRASDHIAAPGSLSRAVPRLLTVSKAVKPVLQRQLSMTRLVLKPESW